MMRTSPGIRPILAALALIGAGAADAPAAGFPWKSLAARPDDWYRGDEAARLAENVLSHQAERGDWPKNFDTSATPYRGDRSKLRGTFDNGATVGEMRFLARRLRRHRTGPLPRGLPQGARPCPGGAVPRRRMAANGPARQGIPAIRHLQRQHGGQPAGARPRRGAVRRLRVRRPPAPRGRRAGLRRGGSPASSSARSGSTAGSPPGAPSTMRRPSSPAAPGPSS